MTIFQGDTLPDAPLVQMAGRTAKALADGLDSLKVAAGFGGLCHRCPVAYTAGLVDSAQIFVPSFCSATRGPVGSTPMGVDEIHCVSCNDPFRSCGLRAQ